MTTESDPTSTSQPSAPVRAFASTVLLVTAVAGTFDIVAAHLHIWAATGRYPAMLFKGIAGGMLGRERALQGGAEIIALGVFIHYFISFAFTLLYFLLRPRAPVLRWNPWLSGTIYGGCVWAVMTYLVLPLSAMTGKAPSFANKHTYIGIGIMILVFGVPIAIGAERYYKRLRPAATRAAVHA